MSSFLVSCGSKSQESTSKLTQTPVESSDTSQPDPETKSEQPDTATSLLLEAGKLGHDYNHDDAIPKLDQAAKIAQDSGNTDMQLNILLVQGISNFAEGRYEKSINILEQRVALLESEETSKSVDDATKLFLGRAYYQQGNYSQALKQFQDLEKLALETNDTRDLQLAYLSIGNVYGAMGDYKQAVSYAEKILVDADSLEQDDLGDATALMGTALWKLNKLPESETYLRKSYEAFEQDRNERTSVNDLIGRSQFAFNMDDYHNGKKDDVEQFETSSSIASLLQQVLIEQDLPEKALEASESGRARVTIDKFGRKLEPTANSAPKSSSQSPLANACQYWSQQSHQLTPEQLQYIQQIGCSQHGHEVKQSAAPEIKSPNIEEIKQIAQQKNITIVEYSVIHDRTFDKFQGKEDKLLIWVVQPTGDIVFEEVDLKGRDSSIKDLTDNWHDGVKTGLSNQESLKELHKLLIDPIAKSLPKDKDAEVVFIPHESMFLVPFAALQNWWGKYLVQRHTISTSPAIEFLALARDKSKALQAKNSTSKASLVVGNPEMPADLVSLPGAEQEARDIAEILNIQPIIGSQATETSILEQISQSNRLHFATHAVIAHEDIKGLDLPGAIALTPDSSNDGWLTSSEIFDLQLNADLVVLSACETARGDIRDDGVIGLSRSFISAGTPSVVASLWTIPDAPTATLMTAFYENLDEEVNKAQALRSAMLETMKKHKEPYNWAAFSLIGESN
ncbi:CHAT domain-containing protein [Waterburya agarophytonicola K14]|uniref:CHAT domain-containing protein n=1 Tax=Waterburya agarophytonicola KI4 TaxID=2874699 RepID=A0A964FGD0_9CYAN|nr:CHAT domain-containing tetratricopeptide repeat protein [Waterburya agarophytonicola]MCC0178092.1 CHAT domain-containing protein [Waterburya agarophytonicola KI4]